MNEMLFRIALRNVLRQKRRTFLSALTIAFGLFLYLTLDSIYAGMDRAAIDSMIELTTASLKLETREYAAERETLPLKYGLVSVTELDAKLRKDPRVTATAPRTRFMAEVSNGMDGIPVLGIVLDPVQDAKVFGLTNHLKGEFLPGTQRNEILLGQKLAEELSVKQGDSITLSALTRFDARNADEFVVSGIINVTDPTLNRGTVIISYATANTFLELGDTITELNVALQRRVNFSDFQKDMLELQQNLRSQEPKLSVESFLDIGASFLAMSKQKKSFGMVFLSVILLIAAVGIFNTVMMSTYERIREIGVLRAHGLPPAAITWMFMFEGALTGVVGSILGLMAGGAMVYYLVTQGMPLDKLAGNSMDTSAFPVWGTLYGEFSAQRMVFGFCFGTAIAILAAAIPARAAGKMTVTRALRFV